MKFSQVPGCQEVKEVLTRQAKEGRVSHAIMLAGNQGGAALPLALAFSTYLVCENPGDDDSCGICSGCSKANKLGHPDIHFVYPTAGLKADATHKAGSREFAKEFRTAVLAQPFLGLDAWTKQLQTENKQMSIGVEEARNIIQELMMKPFEAKYKIMIIWLPEWMNESAANAILKILEEPTPNTVFILVSNSIQRILPTILSRLQTIRINPYQASEVAEYLRSQGFNSAKTDEIAKLSEGSISEALKYVEGADNPLFPVYQKWMRCCYARAVNDISDMAEEYQGMGREAQKSFLLYSLSMIRESVLFLSAGEEILNLPEDEIDFVRKFSPRINIELLDNVIKQINHSVMAIERNGNPRMVFITLSIELFMCFKRD